ncbi:PLP-dependent aminotransferase family protein [Cohnella sp. WQ 127256]|uniref:MocR-like pyridoxine biosynthesis transcription factor PdxR n=1 Tax=Cohnella sp. WQ 127256 TaxID=2938790 RepID=UPI0021185CA1|nr:PLP-dependent aminotransferase family protein [Cohnella sp. WQ 127256]
MFDILLADSDETDQPLYMQLYTQIRKHIRSGVKNGTRMPSVRSLQMQLNISKTPIETAYQMLLAEGYVRSKPRSGMYTVNPHDTIPSLLHNGNANPILKDQQHDVQNSEVQDYLIDFNPAVVDEETFPNRAWRKMIVEALEDKGKSIYQYGDPQGEYPLRSVLADYLRSSRGVNCTPEQLIIGSGLSYSIGILTKLLTGIQYVAMEEPGFAPVREQLSHHGYDLIPISVQEKGLSLEQLEQSKAQAVYVTPSHQFPTGSIIPYAEREYLLEWANTRNAYIIEDDYDGEFRYYGKPIPSLQSLDHKGRVIYIGTFSKAFTPAIRMNYMVVPIEMMDKLLKLQHLLSSPSRVEQLAMHSFIEQGHWYRHIRKMRNTYRKKHHRLIQLLHTHFADEIVITGHSAGLHIQLTVRTERQTSQDLLKLAAAKGVRVYDFQQMWMGKSPPGYPVIYLGFSGLSEAELERGVLLLREAWACMKEE